LELEKRVSGEGLEPSTFAL